MATWTESTICAPLDHHGGVGCGSVATHVHTTRVHTLPCVLLYCSLVLIEGRNSGRLAHVACSLIADHAAACPRNE